MPFKRYTDLYNGAALTTAELTTGLYHNGELSLALSTVEDVIKAAQWRDVIDARGVKRTPPNGGWDWLGLFGGQRKAPKKYCVSIRWNGSLCGIFLGGISKGKDVVSIHYLETPPDMTPLSSKIVPISVAFSAVLASNVNASYLAVYGPNDAMAERLKDDFGFKEIAPFGYRYSGNAPLYRSVTESV
ncbi:hypothetical protein WP3W19E03_P40040 (plasmid) [Aeromonas veronii]|jgi:hypothetical protein|uniref:N-acetyltransferase n=3 Tax=Aeromonas TaxID=642 RepID=A0A6S5C1C0_AERVE|nr:hypothetical protein [Aeromonas veronii]BBR41930.1 hypothetical protein WP3W19E03_P40040 [Aeromonas veronii]